MKKERFSSSCNLTGRHKSERLKMDNWRPEVPDIHSFIHSVFIYSRNINLKFTKMKKRLNRSKTDIIDLSLMNICKILSL